MKNYKIFKSIYLSQNSVLIYNDAEAVIIDPGVLPSEIEAIVDYIESNDLTLKAILLTHTHGDHIAGWNHLPPAPVYTGDNYTLKTQERIQKDLGFIENIFRSNHVETDVPIIFPEPINFVKNGQNITVAGMDFYFHFTPGHCIEMAMIHVPELKLVLTGDMLIQSPYPFILESVLQYRMSLGYIRRIVQENEVETAIPGHFNEAKGDVISERIQNEIQYIDTLYAFLFNHYNPSMNLRELEEAMLHMDSKRINVHFTHKMNVHQLLAEIKHLL